MPAAANTYPPATAADLDETLRLVEADGGQAIARVADVRDQHALDAVVTEGVGGSAAAWT